MAKRTESSNLISSFVKSTFVAESFETVRELNVGSTNNVSKLQIDTQIEDLPEKTTSFLARMSSFKARLEYLLEKNIWMCKGPVDVLMCSNEKLSSIFDKIIFEVKQITKNHDEVESCELVEFEFEKFKKIFNVVQQELTNSLNERQEKSKKLKFWFISD